MKKFYSFALFGLAAAIVFAACSGPSGTGSSAGFTPTGAGTIPASHGHPTSKPSPGPRIGHVVAALTFDGTNFTVETHHSCGHRGLGGITPWTATASGQLVLTVTPSVAPTCAPSTSSEQLFVWAIARHTGKAAPDAAHWAGVQVAGPVTASDNPWSFTPMLPGLTTTAGTKYDFVIATAQAHPTSAP